MSKPIAIYIRRNTVNDKCYMGQSVDPLCRWYQESCRDMAIGHALRKYGVSVFESKVLFWVETQDAANWWECCLIDIYNTLAPNGYNITEGGSNGNPYAGKTAAEMEVTRAKISAAMQGRQASLETRAKISAAMKGKRTGEKHPMYGTKRPDLAGQNRKRTGEKNANHCVNRQRREGVTQLKLFERND